MVHPFKRIWEAIVGVFPRKSVLLGFHVVTPHLSYRAVVIQGSCHTGQLSYGQLSYSLHFCISWKNSRSLRGLWTRGGSRISEGRGTFGSEGTPTPYTKNCICSFARFRWFPAHFFPRIVRAGRFFTSKSEGRGKVPPSKSAPAVDWWQVSVYIASPQTHFSNSLMIWFTRLR